VSGDETFTVSLSVDAQYFADAVSVMAQTMSALETSGASGEELELSRRRYIRLLAAKLERPVKDNAAYIDLCVNSFLLGLPVVNDAEVIKAYTSRSIELEKEKALFRDVADALLDPHRDFVLRCSSPEGMDSSKVKELFEKGWQAGKESSLPRSISVADTLMSVVSAPKVSIKSAKKDPMSGGVEWRFSNGFKVVYRKMDTAGKIHWSMGLGGGFGSIQDLERGEGAFVGDMLKLYRVAGMSGEDFWKFLELRNIDMNVHVGLAAVFLSGSVQTENFRVMLRSLAALANERTLDRDAVATYVKNEKLRLVAQAGTIEDRKAAMDSLMCPDYKYSQIKSRGKLTERLADKADRFYEERFSAMNDGVLVLAGDIDETVLKKELLAMVGMFRTRKSAFYRPSVRYQPVSGWSTHTVDGNENSVYIALSVPMPLAAEDKMASEIAAMVLKRSLSSAIQKTGMSVDISSNTRIYPQERFNVMISLKEASADGFAEGVEHGGALEALRILRTTLRSLETTEVTDVVVKAYKEWLKNDITYRMKSPQYWVNAISMRQIEGKDFSTDYKARVDAVTRDKVKQIITSLNNASKVEYIIRK
jgi:predicted Zn-dependent peptidase